MPDIREILSALSPDDQAMWNEHRTCMRRCYLAAVNSTIGVDKFEQQDDSFLDLIDIRLALLYDRAGLLVSNKELGLKDGKKIEEDIRAKEDVMKAAKNNIGKIDAVTEWGKK